MLVGMDVGGIFGSAQWFVYRWVICSYQDEDSFPAPVPEIRGNRTYVTCRILETAGQDPP